MKTHMMAWACLLSFMIIPLTGHAKWVEAKSENFILVGDTSEKRARQVVEELEEYRAVIFTIFNIEYAVDLAPVRIYAMRSDRAITDMTGREGAAGVYATRRESPLFILNVRGGFHSKSPARAITMHEYTHHLIAQYTDQVYPRWVNEGMAEYLSTFNVNYKGKVQIGLPAEGRAYTLASYKWMDWDVIFSSIRAYPFGNDNKRASDKIRYLFYAQSWLAVHYLQSTPEYARKMSEYVKGSPQATDPRAYFAEVFGKDPDALGKDIQKYYKKNRYLSQNLTLRDNISISPVTVRKLDDGVAEFHRAEAIRQFRIYSEEGRELAEKYYQKAEEKGCPLAQINASRALLDIRADKLSDARTHIDEAMAQDADDGRVLHVAAKVTLAEYQDSETKSSEDQMASARRLLKKSMKANNLNMEAHFDYVSTYSLTGDTPSKQAVYSAKECTFFYRSPNFMADNMQLAMVLRRGGEREFANFHLNRASLWAPPASARRTAKRLMEATD